MSRLATTRHPGEHLAIVSRMYRQVALDDQMVERRRKEILGHLSSTQRLLEAEVGERGPTPQKSRARSKKGTNQ